MWGQTGADTTWCISSEVYGSGYQYVGELTTADVNYENGILLNYTLIDKDSYLWLQTMSDAVTGTLLSTYQKTSGPMLGWGPALELQDYNGVAATGTTAPQYYVNSTIYLEAADPTFVDTLGSGTGVVHTDMVTADGGKTWTIAKITIPAMEAPSNDESSSSALVVAAVSTSLASVEPSSPATTSPESVITTLATSVKASTSAKATTSTKSKHHGHTGTHTPKD